MKNIFPTSFIGINLVTLLDNMNYISILLCCITLLYGYSSSNISSLTTEKARKVQIQKNKTLPTNKWVSNPAIPKMAERIEKKVHASYTLQAMSPKNQYIQNIFMTDAKECIRLYNL